MTVRSTSSVPVANGPYAATPAPLISTSSPPNRSTVAATTRSRSAGTVRSAGRARASPPVARRSASAAMSGSADRATRPTLAPLPTSRSATRRPMPRDAPVRSTTLSLSVPRIGRATSVSPLLYGFAVRGRRVVFQPGPDVDRLHARSAGRLQTDVGVLEHDAVGGGDVKPPGGFEEHVRLRLVPGRVFRANHGAEP